MSEGYGNLFRLDHHTPQFNRQCLQRLTGSGIAAVISILEWEVDGSLERQEFCRVPLERLEDGLIILKELKNNARHSSKRV